MKTQLSLKKQIKLSAENKCAVSTAHETSKEISISTRTFQFVLAIQLRVSASQRGKFMLIFQYRRENMSLIKKAQELAVGDMIRRRLSHKFTICFDTFIRLPPLSIGMIQRIFCAESPCVVVCMPSIIQLHSFCQKAKPPSHNIFSSSPNIYLLTQFFSSCQRTLDEKFLEFHFI